MPKSKIILDETKIATDCHNHKYVGMDGICIATICLVRKHNIENSLGECNLYRRLIQSKKGIWSILKK